MFEVGDNNPLSALFSSYSAYRDSMHVGQQEFFNAKLSVDVGIFDPGQIVECIVIDYHTYQFKIIQDGNMIYKGNIKMEFIL